MTIPLISCCLIIRDDASTLEALLKSIRPHVDEIVVVDTGSTDGSPEIARRYADKVVVWLECNNADTGLIEDFAAARNHSFDLASHEWVCWFDGDDVVRGAEHLRELAAKGTDDNHVYHLPYEYSHDEQGRCTTLQYRERLFRPRHRFHWRSPVHEYCGLTEAPEGTHALEASDSVVVVHQKQNSTKPRELERNLRILKRHVAESYESDVRALHYLGFEYASKAFIGQIKLGYLGAGLRFLRRHVELETWLDQKMYSMLGIADIYFTIEDWHSVVEWSLRASECRGWPEPYWFLCQAFYHLGMDGPPQQAEYNFRKSVHFGQIGLSMPPNNTAYFTSPLKRFEIQRVLGVSMSRIGEIDAAIQACRYGLSGLPEDAALKHNLAAFEKHKLLKTVVDFGERGLIEQDHATLIAGVLNGTFNFGFESADSLAVKTGAQLGAPAGVGRDPVVEPVEPAGLHAGGADGGASAEQTEERISIDRPGDIARNPKPAGSALGLEQIVWDSSSSPPRRISGTAVFEPASGVDLDIILYLGHGLEPWNPDTFARCGMGGSETMAWEMARRLAKLGHRVRLFGHCTASMRGTFEGVEFLDSSAYHNLKCDLLIASRQPAAVDDAHHVEAKARVLWVHDVHCGEALTEQRALRFDRILVLSEWHRGYFARSYGNSETIKGLLHVTRNGIDLKRFEERPTWRSHDSVSVVAPSHRNPHRAIWSSSPDRGLQTAIDVWPRIRAEVPDAELHVFYGFGNWEASARLGNNMTALRAINHLKHLAKNTAGVVFHDRVNQQELAREMMASGVWFYPTWFGETSCISAMEAQAAGLRCITSPAGALPETVGDRGVMVTTKRYMQDPVGEIQGEEYRKKLVERCVEAMRPPDDEDEYDWPTRDELLSHAFEHFGLDELAAEWDVMLRELVAQVERDVVPPFEVAS